MFVCFQSMVVEYKPNYLIDYAEYLGRLVFLPILG
jgi:hypothetical protein